MSVISEIRARLLALFDGLKFDVFPFTLNSMELSWKYYPKIPVKSLVSPLW